MTKKNTELESGKIKINDDVYATIVTMTALDTKGIHHMSSTFNDGVNTFLDVNPIMKVLRYPLTMKEQYQLHYMCAFSMDIVFLMLFYVYKSALKLL